MPDGRCPVEVVGGVPVVAAPEEIDITNAEGLRSALLKAAANGHGTLVVDMTRTRFCDSSGLHALIAAHKRADAEGREVLLVIPGTTVLRVFALTGMDMVIPNFTSLAGALAQAAATANGRGRQRTEGDAGPKASRRGLAPAGELPGTLSARRRRLSRRSPGRLPVPCRHTGKETRRTAPRSSSSSGRSRNAATTGYPSRPLRPGASARGELMAQPGRRRPGQA
jgi:anti-sigma B factor antagonist